MSLINEMLRDLEARGGPEPASEVRVAPQQQRPNILRLPLIGALLAIAALVASVLLLSWPVALKTSTPAVAKAQAATPVATDATTAPAEDVVIEPVVEDAVVERAVPEVAAPVTAETETASMPQAPPAPPREATSLPAAEPQQASADDSVIVRRHEPTPAEKAMRASRDGFTALRNSDWQSAARLLQEVVSIEAGNDDAREGLVVALANQGRIAEADGVLLDGIAVAVAPARFAKMRARLQAGRDELDAALASLSIAVPPIGDDPEFHALKGALAQQAGQYEIAATVYSALTALEPANGTWQAGLGMALDQMNDAPEALAAYQRALSAGQLDAALLAHVQDRVQSLSKPAR